LVKLGRTQHLVKKQRRQLHATLLWFQQPERLWINLRAAFHGMLWPQDGMAHYSSVHCT
jgi:hypothetical protein